MTLPVWWIKHVAACGEQNPHDDRICKHKDNYMGKCDPSACPTMVADQKEKHARFANKPKYFVVWSKALVGQKTLTTARDEYPATTDIEQLLEEITDTGRKNALFRLKSIEIEPKF